MPTRYVRYTAAGETSHGILEGDTIRQLSGDLFDNPQPTGKTVPLAGAKLLLPLDPYKVSKVIGVTTNFQPKDGPKRVSPHPGLFAKYAIGLVTHGDEIEMPPEHKVMHHEGEMVVVIGKEGRFISEAEAPDYVFGVAIGNDVSDETLYGERNGLAEPSRLPSKANDTWSPLGQEIVAGLNYNDLNIIVRRDGEVVAEGRTSTMINSVAYIISYLSQYMTLWPGDLIYMGTPPFVEGKRELAPGQTIEVEIEQIGVLSNKVVKQKAGIANPWWLAEMKRLPPPAPAEPPAPTPTTR
ncbi:MAG TPA: fumarylacetoacetate hydrolase family protein [Dehalococcoidia bacterium]|nr:fumarylacetoacetate hydrolase family protein [Dehalococcoidia bacterium]